MAMAFQRLIFAPLFVVALASCKSPAPGGGGRTDAQGGRDDTDAEALILDSGTDGDAGTGCGLVTCASAHANCGPIGDGCGGVIYCGMCTAPGTCGGGGAPSQCGGTSGCVPRTCADLGVTCGIAGDGCGGVIDCGTCTAPATCGGGGVAAQCGAPLAPDGAFACTPITCQAIGASCGVHGDGCGGRLDCGICSAPATCGGGGTPNACGGGMTMCVARTCQQAGASCGLLADGCGGMIQCGVCNAPDTCGGGGTAYQCGRPGVGADGGLLCTPRTCAQIGAQCGLQGDGCGNTIDCGPCGAPMTCGGAGTLNVCGLPPPTPDAGPACTPRTCQQVGATCGPIGDGCGGVLDCGRCSAPTSCGGGGTPSQCGGTQNCIPRTCQQVGANCGPIGDGCGGVLQCGNCVAPDICGGGSQPSVCSGSSPDAGACTNLCQRQVSCPSGTTSLSGTVYAPAGAANGGDPLYNALVYIPNGAVAPFSAGVSCDRCGAPASGSPLVNTVTGADGRFLLQNVPTGPNIPLVIQLGRWRRQVTISNVNACQDNPVDPELTRLPRNQSEGDIPLIAMVTGNVDALECVLRKIGLDDSEFTVPSPQGGTGRVQFFIANGADAPGGAPDESELWGAESSLDRYDLVLFACEGGQDDEFFFNQLNVINYANAGGRVFATHYSYVWLYNVFPWNLTGTWHVDTHTSNPPSDPLTAIIDTSFPKGQAFSQWVSNVGAASGPDQITIHVARHDLDDPLFAPSQRFIYSTNPSTIQHYAFNTPWSQPPDQQCGRVIFSDFHVNGADHTQGMVFPAECTTVGLSPQEKVLEFMLFDLASCIAPDVPPPPMCAPRTCASANANCGPVADGCGGLLECGACTAPQTCGGGGVPSQCGGTGCSPMSCQQQGISCGPAGDGCGGRLECGSCPSPQTCGGGGVPGQCGYTPPPDAGGGCFARSCQAQGISCGPAGDGCGNLLQCGTCGAPQTCGGGGVPGQCGGTACTPITCTQQGLSCGVTADGCGGMLDCGSCAPPLSCGGGGVTGQCGAPPMCSPLTCMQQNLFCGPTGDGCGGLLDCGTCPVGQVCGGGGNGVCGAPPDAGSCTPRTCRDQMLECGVTGDGCGAMLECGMCPAGLSCGGGGMPGVCGHTSCFPVTCAQVGADCGLIADGCGGTIDCGECMAPNTCGGLGMPNRCGTRF
jgi:hypothetical protein